MWQYRSPVEPWTIHEILVHIADSEANSFIRLRRLVAEPGTAVMGYDENSWGSRLDYHAQKPDDAIELVRWLRHHHTMLVKFLPASTRANNLQPPQNWLTDMDACLRLHARALPP